MAGLLSNAWMSPLGGMQTGLMLGCLFQLMIWSRMMAAASSSNLARMP
jgi:hypothetical protein